ncbi:hypothetical protein [Veillonella caviae]|uniref:hypothetical protein n=1 Tax=Veillonella caviae TaxID=248316 RepID=UPI0023557107|nr:hypothetical protein [Veillonella caviae]
MEIKMEKSNYDELIRLLKEDFRTELLGPKGDILPFDVPIINEILDVLKKQKGLTYVEAYGILQGVRKILEYESNFLLVQEPMTKQ